MRFIGCILLLAVVVVPLIDSVKSKHGKEFSLPKLENVHSDVEKLWKSFKKGFEISYKSTTEEEDRFQIFTDNLKLIVQHNLEHDLGKQTYRLGINEYTAMTNEEFRRKFNGFRQNKEARSLHSGLRRVFAPTASYLTLPASIDWRDYGLVTGVKDQGQCGSCWTFSTTGALEAQYARSTGKLVSLSEQQILDCSGKWGTQGCNGGFMDDAFKYIHDNMGIVTEKSYPYLGKKQRSCKFNKKSVVAMCSGYVDIPEGNETALEQAIALQGPVSVAIDASLQSFQFYTSGVYSDSQCSSTNLDHAVLAVGYGVTNDPVKGKQEYYIVKNSWGTSWGDQGYVKIARNKKNMCGISTSASYPLVPMVNDASPKPK